MRKYQQQQILELLETVKEAQAAELYADCQDGALVVGEFIEALEGEGTRTVALLEEYCEVVFKASNDDAGLEELEAKRLEIIESVKTELKPNRIEVVFIVYQLCMFDSFETIYDAARDDPDCDVFVIPVPFYDVQYDANNERQLGAMHYDGDKFPPDIPVTDWQAYDLEMRHPDVIYTHYPYDNLGGNVSIHPNYFSKKLKEHCDLLVYVPYFVKSGNVVEDYNGFLPGVIYSDKVIVQSEAVRQSYIEGYKKHDKENKWKGAFGKAEDKFVALGSPKFDKVINSKPEDYELPEAWRRLIYDQLSQNETNGDNRKKVILYNTHMFKWINNVEQYFKKIRQIFKSFKESDNVILWWRPHPSTETNFRTYKPEYVAELMQLINEYKSEGWGIYDDTPDLHRAIACTDTYYGDWSSLVALYRVTGKPIVIQDIKKTEDYEEYPLRFGDFTIDDEGRVWAFEFLRDGLFEIDFNKNTARYVAKSGNIPKWQGEKYIHSTNRYVYLDTSKDDVVCTPMYVDNILIYNKLTGDTRTIPLDQSYLYPDKADGFGIRYIVKHCGVLYCFGLFTKAIIVYNPSDNTVRYDTALFDRFGAIADNKDTVRIPIYISECSDDGKIMLMLLNCEHFISYNLLTQDIEIITTNPVITQCRCVEFDGQDFWLLSWNNDKLLKWTPESDLVNEYYMSADGYDIYDTKGLFSGLSDCGEYLLLTPGFGNIVLKFDKKTKHFSKYEEMPLPDDNSDTIYRYEKPKCICNRIYFFARFNFTIYELDAIKSDVTERRIVLDEVSRERFMTDYLNSFYEDGSEEGIDNIYPQPDENTITYLTGHKTIKQDVESILSNISVNTDGKAGMAIYDYINKEIK